MKVGKDLMDFFIFVYIGRDMQNLKEFFPALSDRTYLDTPAVGLISKAVWEFKNRQNRLLWEKGSSYFNEVGDMDAAVREKIAEVYRAQPGRVALFPAFSYGLNAILEGLAPSSKVLLLEGDYPSINWSAEARDFTIAYAPIDQDLEARVRDAFKKQQPDVFLFSIVQYLNGIKMDPTFLREMKKEFPATLFIGDGTQYLGTEPFDFQNSGMDIVGASAYKWIGAGFGNGFFMFNPGVEERVVPKHMGYGSIMGKYKEEGDSFIGKFEGNHLNMANIGAIKVGLEFQEKIGREKVHHQIQNISQKAKLALQDLRLLEPSVAQRKAHSNIFNITGDDRLFHNLQAQGVACSQRGEGIRVGFHYYNTDADLQKLLSLIS